MVSVEGLINKSCSIQQPGVQTLCMPQAMGCIVNNHFKALHRHLKLLSVCSSFFGLLDTFEVLASGMPVLPAIQTALLLRGAAALSQILQASCLGISSVFMHVY